MKFLIFGATGMAGHTIAIYLKEQGYEVTAFTKTLFPFCDNINGDALNQELVTRVLKDGNYDVVINCIGILNQECDKNTSVAVYLNSYLPHLIANCLKGTKTKFIQMSTDCVFSGKIGNYTEKSFRDGETLYDRSKALGEIEDEVNLTFRNSIIGPDMNEDGIGLFNWFMKQKGSIEGYTKAMWTGVTTLTLAKAMERAVNENLTGIYNLVNNQVISKFDLISLFNKHLKQEEILILESDSVKINKSLINTRSDFSFEVPSYEQMILEMKQWIYEHKELYPHYFSKGDADEQK